MQWWTHTNASWLVKIQDGVPGKHLRASELGLLTKQTVQKNGKDVTVYVDKAGVQIADKAVKGDARRAVPLMANASMQLDTVLGNTGLSDLTGGSAVFYDSKVKVEKA